MAARASPEAGTGEEPRGFLPDFCTIPSVFAVVIAGELLAFLFVLAPVSSEPVRWDTLAYVSLFVQWVGLTWAGALCALRGPLSGLSDRSAAGAALALLLVLAGLASLAWHWLASPGPLAGAAPASELAWFAQPTEAEGSTLAFLREATPLVVRNLAVAAIVGGVALRHLYVQAEWRRRMRSEAQARIQALQSRIRPHFLFNSMNTIASLTRTDPVLAERVVEDLAELFRASLGDARVPASLGEELALCERYLAIEALRLGSRLRVERTLEEAPTDAVLPALTLQPLLENAIYHGIEPRAEGGTIEMAIAVRPGAGGRGGGGAPGEGSEGRTVEVVLANPLPGRARAGAAGARSGARSPGNRMALENVRARLEALFGTDAALEIREEEERFEVRVRFPYHSGRGTRRERR